MLGMERGGADVIELGVPFSDPIADGRAIQEANTVSTSTRWISDLGLGLGLGLESERDVGGEVGSRG